MDFSQELIKQKVADIMAITFGTTVEDISSSLFLLTNLYDEDDDKEVIKASKDKLREGLAILRKMGPNEDIINQYSEL